MDASWDVEEKFVLWELWQLPFADVASIAGRFDLNYVSETGEKKRPVIIHRAILGSVERMIAILTESYGGKWPFWISPRQALVVPVAPPFDEYAVSVKNQLHAAGFEVRGHVLDIYS